MSMRFSGTVNAKLDAKGRVFLPSDFRKQLGEADGGRLVLRRDVYQPCLTVYPYAVWEAEVDLLRMRLNLWKPQEAMLFRQFLAEIEPVTPDANGRILIPKRLLQACHITRAVSFIGVDDRIEIWGMEEKDRSFFAPEQFAQAMEQLAREP